MKVAVINSGSSSIKFKLFDMENEELIASVVIENVATIESEIILTYKNEKIIKKLSIQNHNAGLEFIIEILNKHKILDSFTSLKAIGHRVVHGGENFKKATVINDEVIGEIDKLIQLAPLHNKANLEGIKIIKSKAPLVKQVAVFDTSFHSTMPREAYIYALDYKIYEKYKIRRYGFHGTSYSYVLKQTAKELNKDVSKLNIIVLHLGNGASICAIKDGESIDTSMGFTPLEGLVMGTRSGDIDPEIILYLQKELGFSIEEVNKLLNKESGLYGICGENDIRVILKRDDEKSKLAIDIMLRRLKKYIGGYLALLDSIDAVIFTGGIGENSLYIRNRVMDSNLFKNIRTIVIKTDEELEIARECVGLLDK